MRNYFSVRTLASVLHWRFRDHSFHFRLDQCKLRNELSAITNPFQNIWNYFFKFSKQILCTTPMISVESERCFSTLKRIKTFLRNTTSQDWLNELSVLTIRKKCILSMPDGNKKVIEDFISSIDKRLFYCNVEVEYTSAGKVHYNFHDVSRRCLWIFYNNKKLEMFQGTCLFCQIR